VRCWLRHDRRVRPVLSGHCIVDKPQPQRVGVFRSRSVADACGAPVLRDQGPDRPAGHGKADHSFGRATPCFQSQSEEDRYRGGRGTAQVTATMMLSMCLRSRLLLQTIARSDDTHGRRFPQLVELQGPWRCRPKASLIISLEGTCPGLRRTRLFTHYSGSRVRATAPRTCSPSGCRCAVPGCHRNGRFS
jgi:hypothetical protein